MFSTIIKIMDRLFLFLLFLLILFTQPSYGQVMVTDSDCYSVHKSEFDKVSVNTIKDTRLKKILTHFFELSETDYSPKYFIDYKPKFINDSAVYFMIDKGAAKGYEIRLECKNFIPGQHKFTKSVNGGICLIDNKIFWGTDETLPWEEIKKFEVFFNHQKIIIPKSEFRDLFNPTEGFSNISIRIFAKMDRKSEYFIIVLYGSDGAGSYCAVWIFKNGKYLKRVVESLC